MKMQYCLLNSDAKQLHRKYHYTVVSLGLLAILFSLLSIVTNICSHFLSLYNFLQLMSIYEYISFFSLIIAIGNFFFAFTIHTDSRLKRDKRGRRYALAALLLMIIYVSIAIIFKI